MTTLPSLERALALHRAGRLDEAEQTYRHVLSAAPHDAQAWQSLGLLLAGAARWHEAADCFRRAVAAEPGNAPALVNLGNTLNQQGRADDALACFRAALAAQPESALAHNNLGNTLKSLGRIDEAVWHYREALRIAPGDAAAGHNLARTLRSWNGAPLEGRTILVRCEYGLGDTLNFVRYLPWVQKRGAGRILLAAQPALHGLLADAGFGELVSPETAGLTYDVEVSIMDLPCVIRLPDGEVPPAPYLRASEPRVAKWREVLAPLDGFRVGIAWQGNRQFTWDAARSIPLAEFEPLARTAGVRLISLQKGEGEEQLPRVADRFPVTALPAKVERQFTDTAAIMANLDLMIASDSAVAHLAGALGAPVWVALSADPDWRWRTEREDTEWYPTMRLFRQTKRGDWPGVFARLQKALAAQLASGPST